MYGLRFVSDSPVNCVIVITVALGLNGASTCVNLANSLDLAPNYAAAVSAIISTFTTATGVIAPMVVTYFTRENVSYPFRMQQIYLNNIYQFLEYG